MIRRAVEGLDRWITYCGLFAIFITMLLTSADATSRYLLNSPIEGAYQITEDYLLVLLVFLVLGYSYRDGAHIRVTLLVSHVKGMPRVLLGYFAQLFSVLCGVALCVATFLQTLDMYERGSRASGLIDYLLWPAYAAVFLGCLMMTLLMTLDLARVRDGTSSLLVGDEEQDKAEII